MRAGRLFLISAATCLMLSDCTPLQDIELYNDSGEDIVVRGVAGAEHTVSIARGTSKSLDLLVIRIGQPKTLSINTPTGSWSYSHHQQAFGRIPPPLWHGRAFGARCAYARIDSHGRIYLLSPQAHGRAPESIEQPPGFPIKPQ
jgi:hypothetical protein